MKALDYINNLIKERDEIKDVCKLHVETIRSIKKELVKLQNTISKQDKKIQRLENESDNIKTKNELDKVKNNFKKLKEEYKILQSKYNVVVNENKELKSIFDEIENTCDSDNIINKI
jgi:predicted  nucleic acid-binding Zn-ribbon protein